MHPIIEKTFGGLSMPYFMRHFVFGLVISIFVVFMSARSPSGISFGLIFISIISAGLYPYSRFVYESIVDFIMGNNVFFINIFVMLFVKAMTMVMCWALAIFIAPIGLTYLYFYHTKKTS
jgi:hypothetical protein